MKISSPVEVLAMRIISFALACVVVVTSVSSPAADLPRAKGAYVATGSLPSRLANQAAAADDKYVYAIDDAVIGKYDRATGKELARSTGKARHLNSGFLWQGKLYCAHSNYPRKPHQSDIRVLDPTSMKLDVFHTFEDPPGSLTWAVRKGEHWWCHFAHYGKDNGKSVLVQYDERWKEAGRWTYPKELVADWGNYSLSSGIWQGEDLLATGHDKKVIYRLRVPKDSKVVQVVEVVPSPFPGQGIAADPKTGGLVGIDRGRRMVLFARFEPVGDRHRPTLFVIGDSTVRNGTKGQQGWGDHLAALFDRDKIKVENHAIGGRSSRTFQTEGRWERVLARGSKGDFVLIQFGHNDAGPLDDAKRARGSLRGVGDETREIDNPITRKKEVVHTYGWYLRKYITDARARGMTPIILSPVPRRPRRPVEKGKAERNSYAGWAAQVAKAEECHFIDLNRLVMIRYAGMEPEKIKKAYFTPADDTHTSLAGARLNAACVAEGLRTLKGCTLKDYLLPEKK